LIGSPNAVMSLEGPRETMPTNATRMHAGAEREPRSARLAVPRLEQQVLGRADGRGCVLGPVRSGMKTPTTSSPTNFSMIASSAISTSWAAA
jgi:hypothetical protein